MWDMGQKGSTLSYQLFSSGFSLVTYALFFVLCDWTNPIEREPPLQVKGVTWSSESGTELHLMVEGKPGCVVDESLVLKDELSYREAGQDVEIVLADGTTDRLEEDSGEETTGDASPREDEESGTDVTIDVVERRESDIDLSERSLWSGEAHGQAKLHRTLFIILEWIGIAQLGSWRLGVFTAFGSNALLAYIWQAIGIGAISLVLPRDFSAWFLWPVFIIFFAVSWLLARLLLKRGWFLRI